MHVACSA